MNAIEAAAKTAWNVCEPSDWSDLDKEDHAYLIDIQRQAIIAFLRNCEVSEEMELDGVDAWHDSGLGIDVQIRAAFKAMVARQANELEGTKP
jgi:hypothetical protein